ncbi:HD domain-containing protein [Candidatus Tisiphia endosymbiont of Beris chalybata]|uniref:HD domain-containing protein n=1 Tax=Candidatus Tisiphia endosymbiont of Beris chalybata TaxID=3066262 RepID=UPI00312CA717
MEDIEDWQEKLEHCTYSDRLINKLMKLNKEFNNQVDINEVQKAIYYAKKYHGQQNRESGEPYYSHPLEVAYMVSDYLFRTDVIVTSILHDTIEDTKLTREDIAVIFGEQVASQVAQLTKAKSDTNNRSEDLIKALWLQKNYNLLFIKLFDRLHNMRTIKIKSLDKAKKIIEETTLIFIALAAYLENPELEEELYKLCSEAATSLKLFTTDGDSSL